MAGRRLFAVIQEEMPSAAAPAVLSRSPSVRHGSRPRRPRLGRPAAWGAPSGSENRRARCPTLHSPAGDRLGAPRMATHHGPKAGAARRRPAFRDRLGGEPDGESSARCMRPLQRAGYEDPVDHRLDARLQVGERARREGPRQELAHARMQRRVVEHQAGRVMAIERRADAELGAELRLLSSSWRGMTVSRSRLRGGTAAVWQPCAAQSGAAHGRRD